jgi:hypothetical protein
MPLLATAAQLTAPWTSLYDDSPWLQTAVLYAHLAGVLVGGGFALAADQATIRAARAMSWSRRRRQLALLRRTHAPVLLGLGLAVASGLLLLAADVERYGVSPAFWVKMLLVVLLLANGAMLARGEQQLRAMGSEALHGWRPLRAAAIRSASLWLAVLLAGTYLLTGN